MKRILQSCCFILMLSTSCASKDATVQKVNTEVYKARVTYYTSDPVWGNRVACQKAKFAKVGVSVAAHPKFPFGTKVTIPALKNVVGDGNFIVQDRGSAVTKKTASKSEAYVFDVYVSSKQKIEKLKTAVPDYVEVIVQR